MSKFLTLSIAIWLLPFWLHAKAPISHPYYQQKLQKFKQMKKTELIFLGDSLTDYHNWRDFGPHHNAGIAGDTTDGLLYRLQYTLDKKPKTIVLMIGINDLLQGVPLQQVKETYAMLLDSLEGIEWLIILSTLPVTSIPQTVQINEDVIALNYFLKRSSKERGFIYVNLYNSFSNAHGGLFEKYTVDGVHLNDEGYRLWERLLKDRFEQIGIENSIKQKQLDNDDQPAKQ